MANGFTADTTRAVLQAPWEDLKFRSTPTTQTFFYGIDMSLIHKSLPEGFRGRCGYVLEGPYRNVLKQTLVGFAESLDDWATGAVGAKRLPSFFNHLESTVVGVSWRRNSRVGNRRLRRWSNWAACLL